MAAIEMPLRHRPAVVLIDVRLRSGINGVEAAQGICQERPRRVIFPTGSNEIATRLRIDATAPTDVLVKPILPQHLIGALRSLPGSTGQ
jgi:CheY-like chemotaxis protein